MDGSLHNHRGINCQENIRPGHHGGLFVHILTRIVTQPTSKRYWFDDVDIWYILYVFNRSPSLIFEARIFDEMIGVKTDQQLTMAR